MVSRFGAELGQLYQLPVEPGSFDEETLTLAFGEGLPGFASIKKLVKSALKNVFDGFAGLVEPNLFRATYQTLNRAIDEGVARVEYKPDDAFVKQLRRSGAWFAARKSYRQREELARLLVNDAGDGKRSWTAFRKAAQTTLTNYNETWLRVEYNTAIASARSASKWLQYETEKGTYPNLEYLPSRAATPREEHKPYYGVVRPIGDDFWVRHYPPSAYNCMCSVKQSTSSETPLPGNVPADAEPVPGLDHNPGKTKELFSKTHPYSQDLDEHTRRQIDLEGEQLAQTDPADA